MYEIKGRNVMNGLPMHIFVNDSDISHAIEMTLNKILNAITETLEKTKLMISPSGNAFVKGVSFRSTRIWQGRQMKRRFSFGSRAPGRSFASVRIWKPLHMPMRHVR